MASRKVRCKLCPKECELGHLERGDCRSRYNRDGKLITLVYGKPCAVHVDPVEKKPMYHFLPRTRAFSIATAGCNLHCKYCQNFEISQANPEDTRNEDMPPEKVVEYALRTKSASIAYTYSEPMVFYEYVYDTSVIAHSKGIKNILVTAAFINEKPLRELCKVSDGANVDLKGFTEEYYSKVCSGDLRTVQNSLRVMMEEGVFVEITNLVVPTLNDDMKLISEMCKWIATELSPDVPLHFSRFHPMYQLKNLYPTPLKTLKEARKVAFDAGLKYVYTGNVPGESGEDTFCPKCNKVIVDRMGYHINYYNIVDGKCGFCYEKINGVWK